MNSAAHHLPDDLRADLAEAAAVVRSWRPEPLAPSTAASYAAVAARIEAGHDFSAARSPRYMHTVRSAWRRHARDGLAGVVRRMAQDAHEAEALVPEMRRWLGELRSLSEPMKTPPDTPRAHRKRDAVRVLPRTWLRDLWQLATARRDGKPAKHLDALAVLICAGARPAELEAGVRVETDGRTVHLTIQGVKCRGDWQGQPWRRLSVAVDEGAAGHLARLAAGGAVTVACPSGHALSQMVSDLAGDRWGRRLSAYDVRHQRAGDARFAFRDNEALAAWLGHASERTKRHYTRLPTGAGCAGPIPVDAVAPVTVRRPAPRASLANEAASV